MKTAITLLLIIFIFAVLGAEPVESDSLQIPHRSPFKADFFQQ